MKTNEQIMDRIRECELTIKWLRNQPKSVIVIEKEANIYYEMNALKWVLSE